ASPYRVCAEVAVVDRAGIGVDRKRAVAREEVARAADLETAPADEKRASDAIRRQPAPEYAPVKRGQGARQQSAAPRVGQQLRRRQMRRPPRHTARAPP